MWELKPKRQVCYSGKGTLMSPLQSSHQLGLPWCVQVSGLLASLGTWASCHACTAGEVQSSPRAGQAQRWFWTHAFSQVLGNSMGRLLQIHLWSHQDRHRTGTSLKECLTQTPLPPSIHVLQRLPMDEALMGVEETSHTQPSIYQDCASTWLNYTCSVTHELTGLERKDEFAPDRQNTVKKALSAICLTSKC